MLIFLFVGYIILGFAFAILYQKRIYKTKGNRLKGLVVGIEKTISRSRNGSGTFYHPIVEYTYNGGTYYIRGDGSSIIRHQIGKTTIVLSLPDGPEFVMLEDDFSNLFSIIFSVLGLIFINVYYFSSSSSFETKVIFTGIILILLALAPKYIKYKLKKSGANPKKLSFKSRMKLYLKDDFKNKDVFWNQTEVNQISQKYNKQGLSISVSFFILSIIGVTYAYDYLRPKQKNILNNLLKNFDYNSYIEALKSQDKPLILFSIALVFLLMMTHSLIYSIRKMNN